MVETERAVGAGILLAVDGAHERGVLVGDAAVLNPDETDIARAVRRTGNAGAVDADFAGSAAVVRDRAGLRWDGARSDGAA